MGGRGGRRGVLSWEGALKNCSEENSTPTSNYIQERNLLSLRT